MNGHSARGWALRAAALMACAGTSVRAQAQSVWHVVSNSKFPTVVAYDTTRVNRMPHGRAELYERFTMHPPRHDPIGVVGSIVMRVIVDCPGQQSAVRSIAKYAPEGKVLSQTQTFIVREDDFSPENPGSVEASALQAICTALHL
jgi:hypothetical protein